MNGTFAIIAALPGELKPFVKHSSASRWRRLPSAEGVELWEFRHSRGKWIAVCAGMGPARAAVAFSEAMKQGPIDGIRSVGWAGAVRTDVAAGKLFCPSMVIDTDTGERFRPAVWPSGEYILVSCASVAGAAEKARLAASYGASAVDMEAATIARLAQANGIDFYVTKAISDAADAEMLDFGRFTNTRGQLRMVPLLAHVLIRPWLWPGLIRLGSNSSHSAQTLAESLYDWLDEREYARRESAPVS